MRLRLFIGFLVAAVCLYFVFRGISIPETLRALRAARLSWIAAAMVLYAAGYGFRTIRWRLLLEPIKVLPVLDLFRPLIIGFFANNILPFRMGELVRAHVCGRKFHISRTASLGTILLERICDTLSFLSTFIAVALYYPFPAVVEKGAAALAAACFAAIVALFIVLRHQKRFHQAVERVPIPHAWKIKIRHSVDNFAHGISGIIRWRYVAEAMFFSLIVWIIEGSVLYLIARAFNIPLGYPQSFFLLFFMGLSVTLPQAPGYVGSLELFGVTALTLLGIPKQQAMPVILTVHGSQFLFIACLGLWACWTEGMTVSSLLHTNPSEPSIS